MKDQFTGYFPALLLLAAAPNSLSAADLEASSLRLKDAAQPAFRRLSHEDRFAKDFRYECFDEKDADTQDTLVLLGYDSDTWDCPGTAAVEGFSYFSLGLFPPNRQPLIDELGLTEEDWDCTFNHYEDYDWSEMMEEGVAQYWELLGWDILSWAGVNDPPASDDKDWDELTDDEQEGATHVCFVPDKWDERCFDEFFDDGGCDCLPDGCVDEEPTAAPVAPPVSAPTTEAPVVSTPMPTKTPTAPTTPKPTDAPVESPISIPGGEPTASPIGVPGRKPTPISAAGKMKMMRKNKNQKKMMKMMMKKEKHARTGSKKSRMGPAKAKKGAFGKKKNKSKKYGGRYYRMSHKYDNGSGYWW